MSIAAFLMLLTGAVSAVAEPQSPQLGAPHWPRSEAIRVWIDPARAPSGADALVERSMQTWTTAADGRFKLERSRTRDAAAVRVQFVDGNGNYGETFPRVDPRTGLIADADIAIAADAPAPDPLDRQIIIYLTALHEIGHALGLGHTTNFSAIMYLFRRPDDGARYFGAYRSRLHSAADIGSSAATGLSREDIQRLRDLYDR